MNAAAMIRKGQVFMDRRKFHLAIDAFTKAIASDPRNAEAHARRGEAWYARWHSTMGPHPYDPGRSRHFQQRMKRRPELAAAMEDFDAAIRLSPGLPQGHLGKGVILAENGFFDDAVRSFTTAIALDESYADAYYRRALAYEELEDNERALADIETAISLDDKHANALLERGVFACVDERYEDSLRDIDRAIRLDPTDADFHFHRAITLSSSGFDRNDQEALKAAMKSLAKVIRLAPSHAEAYFHRSVIHGVLGNLQEELADLNAALRLDKGYTLAYKNRFECHAQLGRKDLAIRDWADYCRRSGEKDRLSLLNPPDHKICIN